MRRILVTIAMTLAFGASVVSSAAPFLVERLLNPADVMVIGSAGATTHGLSTPDVLIHDDLEVDGTSYFDGAVFFAGSITIGDDVPLCFGDSDDACLEYDTTQTPDTFLLGVSADSRHVLILEKADMGVDWGLAQQTNPTLCSPFRIGIAYCHIARATTDDPVGYLDAGCLFERCYHFQDTISPSGAKVVRYHPRVRR